MVSCKGSELPAPRLVPYPSQIPSGTCRLKWHVSFLLCKVIAFFNSLNTYPKPHTLGLAISNGKFRLSLARALHAISSL